MEELLTHLKRFYLALFAPLLALSAVVYLTLGGGEPLVDPYTTYKIMVALLCLTFIGVATTSFLLRRAVSKMSDAEETNEKARIYEKPYKARIITLSSLAILSNIAYVLTQDVNGLYLVGILCLLILLSYPSQTFNSKR